jgi:NCS2 family nucleobase:cation symporter-2
MSDQTRTSRPHEPDPVDQCPPGGRLFTLALQHVLVMYAGAIAVPLIVGGALKLPKDQIAFLINADLLSAAWSPSSRRSASAASASACRS